jgi:hypothetical protein
MRTLAELIKDASEYGSLNYDCKIRTVEQVSPTRAKIQLVDDSGSDDQETWTIFETCSGMVTMINDENGTNIVLSPVPFAVFAILYA